jgi:hypothetical protein
MPKEATTVGAQARFTRAATFRHSHSKKLDLEKYWNSTSPDRLIPPFPFPLGGKPGRAGSPHGAKPAPPPTRGISRRSAENSPCVSPLSHEPRNFHRPESVICYHRENKKSAMRNMRKIISAFGHVIIWLGVICLSRELCTGQVTLTVTGTVDYGTDGNPNSNPPGAGRVFGGGADLSGEAFTLTFTYNVSKGTSFDDTCPDGTISQSGNGGSDIDSGNTGVLKIGNGSFSLGTLPLSSLSWAIRRQGPSSCTNPYSEIGFSWDEQYAGAYSGQTGIGGVNLYTPSNLPNGDWTSSIPPTPVDPTDFQFYITIQQGSSLIDYAYGELRAATVLVTGTQPSCSATTSSIVIKTPVGSAATCPIKPEILFRGSYVTNTQQTVMVGQQIVLSAALPVGATLATPTAWDIAASGMPIAGFQVLGETGRVQQLEAADRSGNSVTFYWTVTSPDSGFVVTLSCTLGNGQLVTVQTSFIVDGPSSVLSDPKEVVVTATPGSVMFDPNTLVLSFGGSGITTAPPGMTFQAAIAPTPVNDPGMFLWAQLIDEDSWVVTAGTEQQPYTSILGFFGPALDNVFPYPKQICVNTTSATQTCDSPPLSLEANTTGVTRTFSARMFLLWDPLLPSGCIFQYDKGGNCMSIPVPLGSVSWGFTAWAKFMQGWSYGGSGSASDFQLSNVYPEWDKRVMNGANFPAGPIRRPKR